MRVDRHLPRIRTFLLTEAAAFAMAAFLHAGLPIEGYEYSEAIIFESVMGSILFLGYLFTQINPSRTRRTGIAVQGIALIGTVIGRFSIIAGAGPRTILDLVFYRAITAVLIWGLIMAIIAPTFDALSGVRQEKKEGRPRDWGL
ncbi:MAG TPA: hypothetical protein VN666_02425 [Nitrospira sp.]|nr:hypothetical protein [Nitrospira sp.]